MKKVKPKIMKNTINFSKIPHFENNKESQDFYNLNEIHFNKQCTQVLIHLLNGKTITCDEAKDLFGIRHLPRRICTIRQANINVLDRRLKNRCKEYYLKLD